MTERILKAYTEYLRLETLAEIHEQLRPAMRQAEREVIALIEDNKGSVDVCGLLLKLEKVFMGGVHVATYVHARGVHPAAVRHATAHLDYTIGFKRAVRLDTSLYAKRVKREAVA